MPKSQVNTWGFISLVMLSIIDFTDDASVTLTGATEGNMAGLLFFEDRSAPTNRKHHIQSTNVDVLTVLSTFRVASC